MKNKNTENMFFLLIIIYHFTIYVFLWEKNLLFLSEIKILIKLIFISILFINIYYNFGKITFKKIKYLILITIFSIVVKDLNFMIIFLLGILSIKINEKKIDKLFFICGSIFFLITIIMNSFEVLNDKALYRVYKIGKTFYAGEKRESLGFGHPNAVSLYYLGILFPYLKYRYNFFNKIDFFIIGISSYLLYIKTLSRLGLVSSIISLLLVILLKQKFLNKFKFTKNWFIFGIVITFLLSLFSKTKLDYILSFRLSYWKFYFKKITFLGNQSFTEIFEKNRNFILDNTYIYALYVYGVFGTLILMYIFYRCSKNFLRKRRLLILILVLFFTSFSESVLVNRISCCYLLVLMIREELKTNKRVSQIYLEKIKISLS